MGGASSLGAACEELEAIVGVLVMLCLAACEELEAIVEVLAMLCLASLRVPPRARPGAPSASGVGSDGEPDDVPRNRLGHSALGTEVHDDGNEGGVVPVEAVALAAGVCDREAGVGGPDAGVCGRGEHIGDSDFFPNAVS